MTEKQQLRAALGFVRILAGYGCAGVGQSIEDTRLCGKCATCEAAAFLQRIEQQAVASGRARPVARKKAARSPRRKAKD